MTVYWVVALALLNHTSFKGSKVLLSLFALELGASQFLIGLAYAMYSVFPIVLAVYAGKLADRIGMRTPMLLGSAGLASGLAIPFVWVDVAALFVSAALIGMCYIFFIVAIQSLIGTLHGDRAKNYAVYGLGIAASNLIGPLCAGLSIDALGHRWTYLLMSAVPLVAIAWLAAGASFLPQAGVGGRNAPAHHGALHSHRELRSLLLAGGVVETGIELYTFYMPIYGRSIGFTATQIGTLMATYAGAMMIVRFAMPALVRRLGEAGLLRWSMMVSAVAYCVLPFFQRIDVLIVLSVVLGLGLGSCSPLSMLLIHARAPEGRAGEALGLRQTVNKVTESGAPVVFGALGSIVGMIPLFWSGALLLLGGSALLRRGGIGR